MRTAWTRFLLPDKPPTFADATRRAPTPRHCATIIIKTIAASAFPYFVFQSEILFGKIGDRHRQHGSQHPMQQGELAIVLKHFVFKPFNVSMDRLLKRLHITAGS